MSRLGPPRRGADAAAIGALATGALATGALAAAALLAAGLGGAALTSPARAQGIDMSRGGPVEVTANDGIEWRQGEQVVIARGNARAVRDGVTVDADRLVARYRPLPGREPAAGATQSSATQPSGAQPSGAQPSGTPATPPASGAATPSGTPPGTPPAGGAEPALGGANEIWRLEAEGHVRIATATDTARGDRGVYDVDQAVLVLTGRDLGMTTPQQDITARDSLEYWSQRRMAVARGNAVVVDREAGRRVTADTLVAYFLEDPAAATGGGTAPQPVAAPRARTASGEEVPGAGRLDRIEAFGNVEIRTPTEVVRGDRGVYSAATGMARLLGNVRITRGDNQINGQEAIVDLKTGVARLVSRPGARVQGLVIPQQQPEQQGAPAGGGSDLLGPRRQGSGR